MLSINVCFTILLNHFAVVRLGVWASGDMAAPLHPYAVEGRMGRGRDGMGMSTAGVKEVYLFSWGGEGMDGCGNMNNKAKQKVCTKRASCTHHICKA